MEKVLYPALGADCRTYNKFTIARYAICQVTVILFEKETRPPLRYGRFFINHWYLRDIGVILSLLRWFIICPYMIVNPAAALRCAPRRVDHHIRADILWSSRLRIYKRFAPFVQEQGVSPGFRFYFFVWEMIFLIFATGTICFDVQNPNASWRSSVNSVLVYTGW